MMEQITRWWWVRHAPVIGMDGILYGSEDVDCDTSNQDAFKGLAKTLPDNGLWLTSHLSRTRKTAKTIGAAGLDIPELITERMIGEQNFGEWQGLRWVEMRERDPVKYEQFWESPARNRPPNGESFNDQILRVSSVINSINTNNWGRSIVAVAHAGTIRAALVHALEVEPEVGMSFVIDNLSVTCLEYVKGGLLRGKGGGCRVIFTNKESNFC